MEASEAVRSHGDLVDQLEGSWEVHYQVSSDCPLAWQHVLPAGLSQWTDEGDHLAIHSSTDAGSPLQLWPAGPQSLERVLHLKIDGCEATETMTLLVDQMSATFSSGVYSSVLTHSGGACQALAPQTELADQCETLVIWQARRSSSPAM